MDASQSRSGRFSYLLLEDGEVLISDLSVTYLLSLKYDEAGGEETNSLQGLSNVARALVLRLGTTPRAGRLKVATRNIFFDSDDWRDPVVKIPISAFSRVVLSRTLPNSLRIQNTELLGRRFSQTLPESPKWSVSRPRSTDFSNKRDMCNENVQESTPPSSKTFSVSVESTTSVFQREDGIDHPYVEAHFEGRHVFTPLYSEGGMLAAELHSLKNISAIGSRRARESALRELVREREARVPFDITFLQNDFTERTEIDFIAAAVYALSRAPGRVRVSAKHLYFMPIHGDANRAVVCILVESLLSIRRLRHGCKDAALEVEYENRDNPAASASSPGSNAKATLMLTFQNTEAREHIFATLEGFANKKLDIYDRNELDLALARWRRGEMSNYEYLMYLNLASGRSFNDLSQYPVFPWILSDYTSSELDLDNPAVFRDLRKPIGALDESRLAGLKERYHEMPPPRFFYGTHYSTPAYLINYLVRAAPGAMLRLQNGRFDMPDRLFHSIAETWRGVCKNPADVKELIPEFYTLDYSARAASGIVSTTASPGQFLDNFLGLELGTRQDGKRVDSVVLPPWANGSSEKFVRKMRKALECKLVSDSLHHWVDLIFGSASRSEADCNVFYTDVALPRSMDTKHLEELTDDDMNQMETIYLEFGRTPEQLFQRPHPPRFAEEVPSLERQASLRVETVSSIGEPESPALRGMNGAQGGLGEMQIAHERETWRRKTDVPVYESARGKSDSQAGESARRKTDIPLLGRLQQLGRDITIAGRKSLENIRPPDFNSTQAPSPRGDTLHNCTLRKFKIANPKACLVDAILVDLESGTKLAADSPRGLTEEETPAISAESKPAAAALCTISSDSVLRVQQHGSLIRSRSLPGISAICTMGPGQVAYGTDSGTIGYYDIASGRTETLADGAHETSVEQLRFAPSLGLLVSGARDASIKVWQYQSVRHGPGALLLALELDAESRVLELAAVRDGEVTAGEAGSEHVEWAVRQLVVGALTGDGALVVWRPEGYEAGDRFPDPVWRAEAGMVKEGCRRRLAWIGGSGKQRLACVAAEGDVVRILCPVATTPGADVVVGCPEAACAVAREGRLLVGSSCGSVTEFDMTGREVGKKTGLPGVQALLPRVDRGGFVAVCVGGEAVDICFR